MKILFVCTGNTCRSPMAEGLMKDEAEKHKLDIEIESAGIFAMDGQPISLNAIKALNDEGINIRNYRSQKVDGELLRKQDLVLTMSEGHKTSLLSSYDFLENKVYTMKEYAYNISEDVIDPFGGSLDVYLATKEEIKNIIEKIVEKLLED